jgi:C-terminal processing protease CtpA/Prc
MHSVLEFQLSCQITLHFCAQGLGGFPDGEIGIELEDVEFSAGGPIQGEMSRNIADGCISADGVRVSKVMDWGPAHKSSVRVGDIIEKVSGYDVKGLSANFVQHLIKGPSGWIVVLSTFCADIAVICATRHLLICF